MTGLAWPHRKARLAELLNTGDEDQDGMALDRLIHGQKVIGSSAKTSEIDVLKFQNRDLEVVGALEYGQFGAIHVVKCHGRVYIRKSTEKLFAMRARQQCSPQFERDILLRAKKTNSQWAPHLLCAFQSPTHLNLIMDYAEGGTLWDVLESSPLNGRVAESDLAWWAPQIVSAIHWCHSQGFAHRDIKPHNFVLTPSAHVQLIDFGTAAPLLPPRSDGSRMIPQQYCTLPCGTCDYISPEILQAHEAALVALEMDDEESLDADSEGYGVETDWWSLGAMLYEMAFGVAPFFAPDIRQTYMRIQDHEKSLRFSTSANISASYRNLICRLLTSPEKRLGRRNVMEITEHPFFEVTNWTDLHAQIAPEDLHLPHFTYNAPESLSPVPAGHDSHSQGFAFSALFESSRGSSINASVIPPQQNHHETPSDRLSRSLSMREDSSGAFIGFTWGPTIHAFASDPPMMDDFKTPRPTRFSSFRSSQKLSVPASKFATPGPRVHFPYATPMRGNGMQAPQTLLRTSTVRRTLPRRELSDREAMQRLTDCIGMSARKKVLESGKKPRFLGSFSGASMVKRELRFDGSPRSASTSFVAMLSGAESSRSAVFTNSGGESDTETSLPPSPSPSPRPGSAMSRRSGTPTITGSYSQRTGSMIGTSFTTGSSGFRSASFKSGRQSLPTSFREQQMASPLRPPPVDEDTTGSSRCGNLTLDAMDARLDTIMGDIDNIGGRIALLSKQLLVGQG